MTQSNQDELKKWFLNAKIERETWKVNSIIKIREELYERFLKVKGSPFNQLKALLEPHEFYARLPKYFQKIVFGLFGKNFYRLNNFEPQKQQSR